MGLALNLKTIRNNQSIFHLFYAFKFLLITNAISDHPDNTNADAFIFSKNSQFKMNK